MRITDATDAALASLWTKIEPEVGKASSLEDAAQVLAKVVDEDFGESTVLARVFVTVPFKNLPAENQDFVRKLAESAGAGSELKPDTAVLSLIGTHGEEADWQDRRKSQGHVGIPLISVPFVDAIPMISRLLKELGVPLDWVESQDGKMIEKIISGSTRVFFVDNAAEATDQQGRKIIAAQDFVSKYKVKSVFGTGGAYPGGQIIVFLVFCQEGFAKSSAEHFLGVTESFKNSTAGLAQAGKIFASA